MGRLSFFSDRKYYFEDISITEVTCIFFVVGCLSSESSEAEDSPENTEDDTSKLIDDGIKLTRRTSSQIERSSIAQLTKTELERYLEFLPELSEFQVEIKVEKRGLATVFIKAIT